MLTLAERRGLPLLLDEGYEVIDYFNAIRQTKAVRCEGCFHLRLGKTAERAREGGFSAFTTTLLLSPYQKQKLLRLTGETIAEEKDMPFLHVDLRGGYRESHRMVQELHLYHQNYCGCVYSEWERYCRTSQVGR
jgi:predicted adenine nucleotide alpha hydrolase (AANH) superfamily ATPase